MFQNMGVAVISIGIGPDINPYEISSIATDKQHSFTIGSFAILHTLIEDIKEETCGRKLFVLMYHSARYFPSDSSV